MRFSLSLAALAATLACSPAAAGISAQYGADDPHLDALVTKCGGPYAAYRQVLESGNPPEIVEVSISNILGVLRSSGTWSPADLAKREAQLAEAQAGQAPGAPPSAEAAFVRCVLHEEAASRTK